MAQRQITVTPQTTDDTRPTNGGGGTTTVVAVAFDDAGKPAEVLAAFDRAVELVVRDYSEQGVA